MGGRTTVDIDQLRDSLRWLRDTKWMVDLTIEDMKKIPKTVGGATVNEADPNKAYDKAKNATVPAAGSTPGMVTEIGATFFGIFDNGMKVAAKHAGIYNSVLQGLTAQSQALDKAIAATQYLVDNYAKVESLNGAGMAAILANPATAQSPGRGF